MSISISVMPSFVQPYRFDEHAGPVQLSSLEPTGGAEAVFDGHMKASDFLPLLLELLALIQKQRAADRALGSALGLVAQDMSLVHAQYVRSEGTDFFAGAFVGAMMVLVIGAVGAVISHRALGKQLSNSERQDGLGVPGGPVFDGDVNPSALLPAARPRELRDDILEMQSLERRSVSGSEPAVRPRELRDDILEMQLQFLERRSVSGSVRSLERGNRASVSSRASVRGDSEVVDGHDNVDFSNVGAPAHNGIPRFSYETRQVAGRGLVGQMLMANTASLAAIGAAGGQMVAAMDRANSGLTQTSGMISESTKHNRDEEARLGNEAVTRALTGLRGMNEDLRQTMSQIISSIKA